MKLLIFLLLSAIVLASENQTKKPDDVEKGEKLIQSMLKAIEMKDEKKVKELFEDDFVYEGCKKMKLNKEESAKIVFALGIDMAKIMEKNSEVVSIGHRKFYTNVSKSSLISEFIVSKNWKLQAGKTTSC